MRCSAEACARVLCRFVAAPHDPAPLSLLMLTLRVAAIPSAATICSTACASPASLRHADVPEALIAAGEPRHADAQLAWPWPRRPLRGLNGSASLAGPVPCPSHLQGRAVGPEGCVRERQPACVGRQPWPLPSPPCARVLASLLLSIPALTPCLFACLRLHDPRPAPSPSHTGLDDFTSTGGSLLLEQGRLTLAQEFVKAMADPRARAGIFGVLLSGPNGVGEVAERAICASHDLVVRARAVRSAPKLTSALVFSLTLPCCCRQERRRLAQLPGVRRPAPARRVHPTRRGLGQGCQGRQGRRLLPAHAA